MMLIKFLRLVPFISIVLTTVYSCAPHDVPYLCDDYNLQVDVDLIKLLDWEMADSIQYYVNEHRVSMGFKKVEMDNGLASIMAMDHSNYMKTKGKISHDNFNMRSCYLKSNNASSVGENVASGYDNSRSLVRAWLNSEKHREVIEGNFEFMGLGVIKDDFDVLYYTMLLYSR